MAEPPAPLPLDTPADGIPEVIASERGLDACAAAQKVEIRKGDFVIVRTGQMEACNKRGDWGTFAGGDAPGLKFESCYWLHEKEVAGVCSDTWGVEVRPNETPDVILTVIYGRGFLENPYLKGIMVDYSSDPPVETLDGLDTEQIIKERDSTYEEHLQNAQYEKLFVRVSAWAYPGKPPPKPKHVKPYLLWKTTVLIDDPINRDLNQYVEKMLEAAAPYFDHKTPDLEAFSSTTVPEGHVTVGDAKVVPPKPDLHK